MFDKIAQVGVLSFISVVIVILFAFLTVASVVDIPGVRQFDGAQLVATTVTLVAALGGAAAARFGGSKSDGGTP